MSANKLKAEVLVLAGYLSAEEEMTAADAAASLRETVARVCSSSNTTPVMMTLIAAELAHYIDGELGK